MKRLEVRVPHGVRQQIREQGHAVDEDASERLGGSIHKMVFERTYLIHYEVNEAAGTVEVVNFRHGTRLPRRGEP